MTSWFVQPHFDDIALSCGGRVAALADAGERPLVLTIFGGAPDPGVPIGVFGHEIYPKLAEELAAGVDPLAVRKREDVAAVAVLGAEARWWAYPEAVFRGKLYGSPRTLCGAVRPEDAPLVATLGGAIVDAWRAAGRPVVYLPLGIGRHVDHQIVHALGAPLRSAGAEVLYYEDFPYALLAGSSEQRHAELPGLRPSIVDVTATMPRRLAAIAAYASQLDALFHDELPYDRATRAFAEALAGAPGRHAERYWRAAP